MSLNGYWFNYRDGYLEPVGTTKFNRRYMGIPQPTPVDDEPFIFGEMYQPYGNLHFPPIVFGEDYTVFGQEQGINYIFGSEYKYYQGDITGINCIFGRRGYYELSSYGKKGDNFLFGGSYEHFREPITGTNYIFGRNYAGEFTQGGVLNG